MASISWEVYCGQPQSWRDIAEHRLVFSGDFDDVTTPITPGEFNSGTHLSSQRLDIDGCMGFHVSNSKFIDSTHVEISETSTFPVVIQTFNVNNTNWSQSRSISNPDYKFVSFRIHFQDTMNQYKIQNSKIFCFDGDNTKVPGRGVDVAILIAGTGMTAWKSLNSESIVGPSDPDMQFNDINFGGDYEDSRLLLPDKDAAADIYYPCVVSVSPEDAGQKTALAFGVYLEYF